MKNKKKINTYNYCYLTDTDKRVKSINIIKNFYELIDVTKRDLRAHYKLEGLIKMENDIF